MVSPLSIAPRRAFTLIELLIVVAIIAILAAIAVPNFLEAQTRAKVSRAKSDMRTLSLAIESYYVDNNSYTVITGGGGYGRGVFGIPEPGGYALFGGDRLTAGLTTPVSYITAIPLDTFGKSIAQDLYNNNAFVTSVNYLFATKQYFDRQFGPTAWKVSKTDRRPNPTGTLSNWVLQSKGPDLAWARSVADGGAGVDELDAPFAYEYDPTNGTISTGNIVRAND